MLTFPVQVLENSGLLDRAVGAFFYDRDMKLITGLGDEEVKAFGCWITLSGVNTKNELWNNREEYWFVILLVLGMFRENFYRSSLLLGG